MSLLCVKVKKAKLHGDSVYNSYTSLKVQNVKSSTVCVKGNEPVWEQDYMFEINRINLHLTIEVWNKGVIRDKLIGLALVKLNEVAHSSEEGEGYWLPLYLNMSYNDGVLCGTKDLTPHSILCDIRFEFPSELSDQEILTLQQKLDQLNELHAENWMVDYPFHLVGQSFTESSISLESDYHSDTSYPIPFHTAHHVNSSASQHAILNSDSFLQFTNVADSNADKEYQDYELYDEIQTSNPSELKNCYKAKESVHQYANDVLEPIGKVLKKFELTAMSDANQGSDISNKLISPAKYRWIKAFNKIRLQLSGEDHDDKSTNELSSKKPSLWNFGLNSAFFSSIDSKPEILPRKKSIPFVSDLSIAVMKRQPGLPSALTTTHASLNDTALKMHVYKKTLQALLYPVSCTTPHNLYVWSATTPAYCFECQGLLWGIARQGLRCSECGVKCHEKCQDLLNADCLQRAAERSTKHGAESKANIIMENMVKKMEQRLKENPLLFNLVRKVFNVTDDEQHKSIVYAAKQSVVDGTTNWFAKLHINVVSAQGLQAKDKTGSSDPYATIQVGKVKKRTRTIYNNLNPFWDETFSFESQNYADRIKVRVWDEDDDMKSRFKQHIKREGDDFLGQTTIEVQKLSGEMDVWYNLQKRTDKSAVSGAIRLRITLEEKGEEKVASYHVQYSCLHENIFQYIWNKSNDKVPLQQLNENNWKLYFVGNAQKIIDEFAVRYGVESIYQAMTHFSCLSWKYKCTGIPAVMSSLLANINAHYARPTTASYGSASGRFAASNFGTEKFVKLLDNLHNSLRIDLSMYRKHFPASDQQKMSDLKSTVDLLTSITFFRMKVQELHNAPKDGQVIKECVKACVNTTYHYLFNNSADDFTDNTQSNKMMETIDDQSSHFESLDFWSNLITLVVSVLEEDKLVYAPVLNHFPNEFSLVAVSANEMWLLFSGDLKNALFELKSSKKIEMNDFINLQFKVKYMWILYIKDQVQDNNAIPEYFKWFQPFTLQWLQESEKFALHFVEGAYERDKRDEFQQSSDHSLFSCSVVDTFTQLNQTIDIITKLECSDFDVFNSYMVQFAKTIEKVLMRYVQSIKNDFEKYCHKEKVACILMNNVQQLRVQLQNIFQTMGGNKDKLNQDAKEILQNLQLSLNSHLSHLSQVFGASYSMRIDTSVKAAGTLLFQIKSSNAGNAALSQKTKENEDAVFMLRPLMELLNERLELFSKTCEPKIFKRVLKELWILVIKSLEKNVVLPPLIGVSGPHLLFIAAKELSQLSKFKDNRDDIGKSLSSKQCDVLNCALDIIKQYFHACGNGLKNLYLEKSEVLKSLKYALSLYTQTTDALIKIFVQSQTMQDDQSTKNPLGHISAQIDVHTHPGTGEHKVTVKVVSANNIKWKLSSMFRPFVEVNMIGPHLNDRKRKYSTKSKSATLSPIFNETFRFNLSNDDKISNYELHFCVKDFCIARDSHVLGLAVLQLKELGSKNSCNCMCTLGESISLNETGWTILRILSQRTGDEVAKEFVQLKSCSRSAEET